MSFASRQSLKIFITGILILIIASVTFYKLNYDSVINYQLENSKFITEKISTDIDIHLIEKVKEVKTIIATPIIINSLSKSNKHYQVLTKEKRDKEILQKNKKWRAIKDENNSFILDYTNNEVSKYLKTLQQNIKGEYGEIFLTNKFGALVASTSKLTTFAHGQKYWWKGAFNDGKGSVFLDDRGYDDSVGGYVLGVVVPIKKDNKIIGILKANLNILGSISTLIANNPMKNHEKLKLIRSGGLIVFEDGIEPLSKRISGDLQKIIQAKQKKSFIFKTERNKFIIGYSEIKISTGKAGYAFGGNFESIDHKKGNNGESWIILDFNPFSNAIKQTTKFISDLWLFGILLTIILAITSFILGKRTAKPLKELIMQIKEITKGNYDFRIISNRKDEIGKLAISFNQMSNYLKESTTSIANLNAANQQLTATEQKLRATNQQLIEKEQQLKVSEDRLSKTLMAANDGMWDWDLISNKVYFDPRYYEMAGYEIDEFPYEFNEFQKRIHPDDVKNVFSQIQQHFEGKTDRFHVEFRLKKKNGDWLWVLGRGLIVERNKNNKPLRFIGTHTDITERKKTEKELSKLSAAVTQSPSVIAITNLKGDFEYVNPKFTELTGYTLEEVKGKNPSILKSGEQPDELYAELWKTISSGKKWRGEFHNKKKNGELFWESASVSPIFDEHGKIINYVKVAEDITDKKRIEKELFKMDKLKSIGTLAGGIAHDFNNILTGIYGYVSLALIKLDENHPSYHFLTQTEKSLERATKLTKQLLTFSKGGTPIKENVNLSKIIEETVIFDLSGSNVKPVFNFAENLMKANVDKSQMEQVFSNLAINARQASPNGGHLYISITNSSIKNGEVLDLEPGKYLKITVQDEGTGIPKKYIDKIFEPYFTTKKTGNGLGLATTYSIIKKHNGHLSIESEVGKGTKFTIYLPASQKEIKETEQSKVIIKDKNKTAKILIMDDNDEIREMAMQMIEMLGFEGDSTADGEQTITKYKEALEQNKPYDIIIMDLTIPGGMGGKEAVKKILEIDRNAKVIVSSGYASGGVLADYKSLGFADIINKPYTMDKLKEVLHRVLSNEMF